MVPPKRQRKQKLPEKFSVGFLSDLDGRTDLARALRANRDAIVTDLGGDEELSHVKNALVERFVWLEGILHSIEHDMAKGQAPKTEAIGKWVQAVNSLSGLAKVLGTDRQNRIATAWEDVDANNTLSNGDLEDK